MPILGQLLLIVLNLVFVAGCHAAWRMAEADRESAAIRLMWLAVLGLNATLGLGCFALLMSTNEPADEE